MASGGYTGKIDLNSLDKASLIVDAPTIRIFEFAGFGGFQNCDYMPSLKKKLPNIG